MPVQERVLSENDGVRKRRISSDGVNGESECIGLPISSNEGLGAWVRLVKTTPSFSEH